MIAALIGMMIAAVVGLMLLGIVFAVFGAVFGVIGLAFKLLPLLLVGWIVVSVVRRLERPRYAQLSTADRRWLDR